MRVLGLNAYAHDAGVALVEDGKPVFALEEERLNRVRKTTAFPSLGLEYLQTRHGLSLADVDAVAFPWRPARFIWTVAQQVIRRMPPAVHLLREAASPNLNFSTGVRFWRAGADLGRAFGEGKHPRVRYVAHHGAHAANAFFLSPFERAAVLVMDAFGDECSTSSYLGAGSALQRRSANRFFQSIGIVYSMVTKYLGFRTILDEGKVMALAAYGSDELQREFRETVKLLPDGRYAINEKFFGFHRYGEIRPVSHEFIRRFGPARLPDEPITQRHMDIASGLQHVLEETILHVARHLRTSSGEPNLCFAGGTALNCLTNRRLLAESGFDRVFIPPNPNDAGVALGAALALSYQHGRRREAGDPATPYLGPSYDDADIRRALGAAGLRFSVAEDVAAVAARELARGRPVAWFQGPAEMGPRALGNRSILADPRDAFVPELLNRRVKQREYFRPYAPAVLAERAHEFFENAPPSPYMSFAAIARPRCRLEIPAVLAHDGTARVQTVTRDGNPLFHRLLEAFARQTGLPILLNTSFNRQEPTVCTPEAAVRTFVSSGLPVLIMGRCVAISDAAIEQLRRPHEPSSESIAR